MKESRKLVIGAIVAIVLVVGLFAVTADSRMKRENKKDIYETVKNLDDSYQSLRSGGDPTSSLRSARSEYGALVRNENFADRPELGSLDNEISNDLENLISDGDEVNEKDVMDLKAKVSDMAGRLESSLPGGYAHAELIILGFSFALAFLATLLCKNLVDWDRLSEAKKTVSEWKERILEARRSKRGKKNRKLEVKSDEADENKENIWKINGKQAVFYLSLFLLFLAWLSFVYADWNVVWLPFDWFKSGSLSWIGVSFGSFGWFLLSYFGFSQVWRIILLSNE